MDKIPGVNYLLPATVFHKATEVHKTCSIFYMHMYNTPSLEGGIISSHGLAKQLLCVALL